MKHKLLLRTLAATLLSTAAFAAWSQILATELSVDADAQAQPLTRAEAHRVAEAEADVDRYCLRQTGSRIVAQDKTSKKCTAFGRVYTQEDIQLTGATNLTDAIKMLDPSIR